MGRRRRSPFADRADPPYGARGRDSLCLSRTTRADLSRSPLFPADRRQTSPAGKPHLTAGSMGTYAEFVIAVVGLGALPLLGLGLPGLFNRLQRREIFHQETVS